MSADVSTVVMRGVLVPDGPDLRASDLLIAEETIGEIASAGTLEADRVVDAAGLWALPGAIDSHIHPIHNETFASTGSAAAFGGVTTILHHLYPEPDETMAAAAARADAEARLGAADFGYHIRVTRDRLDFDLDDAATAAPTALKGFLAHSDPSVELAPEDLYKLMRRAAAAGHLVYVHSEHGPVARDAEAAAGQIEDLRALDRCRPAALERAAVGVVGALAEMTGCRIHFPHLSSAAAVDMAVEVRDELGVDATLETCPHYLFLDYNCGLGPRGRVSPPLRSPADVSGLRDRVASGEIDLIASDHCGYDASEKDVPNIGAAANGLPGLETLYPLLLDAAIEGEWLSPSRLVELTATAPSRAFGLRGKGELAPGRDADIVLVDPAGTTTVRHADHHDRASYSPYEGWRLRGCITHVFRRGEPLIADGTPVAAGSGRRVALSAASNRRSVSQAIR